MTEPREARVEAFRQALAEATSAARTAEASANELARTINGNGVDDNGLRGQLADHTAEITRLDRGRKVNRLVAVLALVFVLTLAAVVTLGWVGYQNYRGTQDDLRTYQACVNAQNDARAKSSQDFYQHIDDLTAGQLGAFQRAVAHPDQAPQAVTDYINATSAFHDYAQVRLAQLSAPPKGC
jgi:hypothetical protein